MLSEKLKECRYLYVDDLITTYDFKCKLDDNLVLDDDLQKCEGCKKYKPRKRCDECVHARIQVWETGAIDQINYYCKLQDGKLIYKDLSFSDHDPDWPDCNIEDKFEYRLV